MHTSSTNLITHAEASPSAAGTGLLVKDWVLLIAIAFILIFGF